MKTIRGHSHEYSPIRQSLSRVLGRYPNIRLAFLFGSVAKGQQTPDSDLDLAVTTGSKLDAATKAALFDDLAAGLGRPVDLIDLEYAPIPLLHQIFKEGKMVVCKDRNLYAALIKRLVFEEADYMPYYRRILAERRNQWIEIWSREK